MWEVQVITVLIRSGRFTIAWLTPVESVPAAESDLNEWRHAVPEHEGFKDAYRIALGTTYYYDETGPSVQVSPLMTAQFRLRIVYLHSGPGPFLAECRYDLRINKDASVDVGVSYMHGQSVKITKAHTSSSLKVKPGCSVLT